MQMLPPSIAPTSKSSQALTFPNNDDLQLEISRSSSPVSMIAGPSGLPTDYETHLSEKQSKPLIIKDPVDMPVEEIRPLEPSVSKSKIVPLSHKRMLLLSFKKTFLWVTVGIATMIIGIGIIQVALLPRIYTCPSNANCPGSFDPNSSNVLQLVQTLMSYWLQAGIILVSFGLMKLSAYQSWFIMMRDGNTIQNLDSSLGAIKGSVLDASLLLFKKGNRWLATFILIQNGIGAIISLLVGLSLIRNQVNKTVQFNYPEISTFPDSKLSNINNDGQVTAMAKVIGWALNNDTSHGGALRGTLVIPDDRSKHTVFPRPGGPHITGDISCTGVENVETVHRDSGPQYNVNWTANGKLYIALPNMRLAVTMTNVDTALTHYLWVSNTSDLLPNASATSDGRMHFAFCNHTISMINPNGTLQPNEQEINPNIPMTSGCAAGSDMNICVADSVNNAILSWWGGVGTAFWNVACRGGILGPLKSSQPEVSCPLTKELWIETATAMLDGIMQTAPRSGRSFQELTTTVDGISLKKWWLQGIIPLLILLLYLCVLIYTVLLSQGNPDFKELDLAEVVTAAQNDYFRRLVQSGGLKKSTLRYGCETGFMHTDSS